MREVSFVKRLRFNFDGSVTKRALVIGDADNDRRNELVCANLQGNLAIFKGKNPEKFAHANNLGMVTACSIGDIINSGKNHVTAINMEGWLFIFDVASPSNFDIPSPPGESSRPLTPTPLNTQTADQQEPTPKKADNSRMLTPMYEQRMPANCKEMLLADLDGDGLNELIIGLTDRVLRTYKWVKIGPEQGKFVGLYKWEFADQIGSVSLNPSRHDNCQDIIVAQPGGTYAKLECFDKKPMPSSKSASSSLDEQAKSESGEKPTDSPARQQGEGPQPENPTATDAGDNVRTEYVNKLTPEYHQLALSQMRNHHVSTEVLGNIKDGRDSKSFSLIVIATLDGTLMLVNKDEILWSLQVDHQLFALAVLEAGVGGGGGRRGHTLPQSESTCTIVPSPDLGSPDSNQMQAQPASRLDSGSSGTACELRDSQHFAACAWNGKTYIIDEERNYLRFKFDEAVSAFTAGSYHFDDQHHASLVYATFNNQIVLYYDVLDDGIRPVYLLNEIMTNPDYADLLEDLHKLARVLEGSPGEGEHPRESSQLDDSTQDEENDKKTLNLYKVLSEILYNINDEEISSLSIS